MNEEERKVYLNGNFISESEASISIFDRGFLIGEGVHDVVRTFNHKFFRLDEHIERLFESARSIGLDLEVSKSETKRISEKVLNRNLHLLDEDDDYWFFLMATRGKDKWWTADFRSQSTLTLFCTPLPYNRFAKLYESGAHIVTPSVRQVPSSCYDPKIKLNYRPQIYLARTEVNRINPEALALMLDMEGNVTEGDGWNFFIVKDEELITAKTDSVLEGISRSVTIELAENINISVKEQKFQLHDVYNADEAFMTATSKSILPVSKVNGVSIRDSIPGPITGRLIEAWKSLVGIDFVSQALRHSGGKKKSNDTN